MPVSKYILSATCRWCGSDQNLKEIKLYSVGTKNKRYHVMETACDVCARRLTRDQKDD